MRRLGVGIKNPRLCRVNHLFEPFYKVGARYWLFQAFCLPTSGEKADLHTANKERPQVQNVGSKTNVNHAHRRGE